MAIKTTGKRDPGAVDRLARRKAIWDTIADVPGAIALPNKTDLRTLGNYLAITSPTAAQTAAATKALIRVLAAWVRQ